MGMHLGTATRRDREGLLGGRAFLYGESGELVTVPLAGSGDV